MNLKQLTDSQLLIQTEQAVKVERHSTAEVIRLFQEIFDRKLYLERGFPSLFEMATKHFGYCAGSAMRRINSMKLVRAMPEVEEKIETGELSLTVAANLQSFFQSEAKSYSADDKAELIDECLGKSTREVEKELARRNPEREKREFARHVSEERIRVSFTISDELNSKIDRLKTVLSHVDPAMTLEGLLERLVELGLDKHDPVRKAKRSAGRNERKAAAVQTTVADRAVVATRGESGESEDETVRRNENARINFNAESKLPAQEVKSRHIPASERHAVHQNSDGCEFIDQVTGRRCGSRHTLQVDHVIAFSEGGAHERSNLQILCGAHNRLKWQAQSTSRYRDSF